jgi:hypothetical protein
MKAQFNQLQSTVKDAIGQLGARAGQTRQALRAETDRRVAAVRQVISTGRDKVQSLGREAETVQSGLRARIDALRESLAGLTRHPVVVRGLSHPVAKKLVQRLPEAWLKGLNIAATENDAAGEDGAKVNG